MPFNILIYEIERMMKKRKAQLQMGENVIVLVIFFFLLVIAILFYVKIQKSNLEVRANEMKTLTRIDLKTFVSNIPEIKCVESGDTTDNCIDIINIKAMGNYWQRIKNLNDSDERAYYEKRFGNSKITVRILDPLNGNWTESYELYSSSFVSPFPMTMTSPMTIYNPLKDDYDYGEIIIEVYYIK